MIRGFTEANLRLRACIPASFEVDCIKSNTHPLTEHCKIRCYDTAGTKKR